MVRLGRLAIAAVLATLMFGTRDAPATVEEQRARLPAPAECPSPVSGQWKAIVFKPRFSEWYTYTLEVHEDPADASHLLGMIYIDAFFSSPDSPEPAVPCVFRFQGKMVGAGTFASGEITFGATSDFELTSNECGDYTGVYNPDHFQGQLEPARQEFQSIHNDHGLAVNEPTVFRRFACIDDSRKAPRELAPPPFFPKHRSGC
jgi:hypothetical protein